MNSGRMYQVLVLSGIALTTPYCGGTIAIESSAATGSGSGSGGASTSGSATGGFPEETGMAYGGFPTEGPASSSGTGYGGYPSEGLPVPEAGTDAPPPCWAEETALACDAGVVIDDGGGPSDASFDGPFADGGFADSGIADSGGIPDGFPEETAQ